MGFECYLFTKVNRLLAPDGRIPFFRGLQQRFKPFALKTFALDSF